MDFKIDLKFIAKASFEALMIVFAVILAFLVTEWREDNEADNRANLAVERIVLEMEANIAELQRDELSCGNGAGDGGPRRRHRGG